MIFSISIPLTPKGGRRKGDLYLFELKCPYILIENGAPLLKNGLSLIKYVCLPAKAGCFLIKYGFLLIIYGRVAMEILSDSNAKRAFSN